MKFVGTLVWLLLVVALAGVAIYLLGLQDVVRASLVAGHSADWIMGALCLIWLVVILKVPWDLYFQTQEVLFELERAQERGITPPAGRAQYLRRLRVCLGQLAVGAHLASAVLIAVVTYATGGAVGYYFAGFYLISTLFRPAAAGYVYLSEKLSAISQELHYPREDVVEMRARLDQQESTAKELAEQVKQLQDTIARETSKREAETRELRQDIYATGRELETTISRLTDNQEVIRGIQAFVRLITSSSQP